MSETNEKGNILKIVALNLQNRVYEEIKKVGFSAEALSRQFEKEDIFVSAHSIRKFIKKTKKAQQALIQKDIKASNELVKLTMDYNKALRDILNEVEEVKNEVKDEKDFTTYNQLIGRLLQGIELFAKLTGDINPKGKIDINIIYNQINNEIEKDMKEVKNKIDEKLKTIDIDCEVLDNE